MGAGRVDCDSETCAEIFEINAAHFEGIIADDFARGVFHDFIEKAPVGIHLGDKEIAGRNICDGDSRAALRVIDREKIIVLCLVEREHIHICAGCDNPRDGTLNESLRQLWVFDLVADGHFIALGYQLRDIGVDCVERNPAHRGPLFKTALFSGERELEFLRGGFRVIEKHLEEVSDPVH